MQPVFDYVLKNKEWIFSGIGVFGVSAVFLLLRLLFFRRPNPAQTEKKPKASTAGTSSVPTNWHAILPPKTKYEFTTESTSFIPLGVQSFSFEYGPHGHSHPLNLKGTIVRAEIEFTCRIGDLHKAMFGANEYGLNILQPKFLTQARTVLERYSITKLRASREQVAREIVTHLSTQFEKLGFSLESVTIGALDKVEHAKA